MDTFTNIKIPIKSILMAVFIIYLSISTNYINISPGIAQDMLKHQGLRLVVIFFISYLTMHIETTTQMEKIIGSIIVTAIFYSITKKGIDKDVEELI